MPKVILSADSTCDLGDELIKKYHVQIQPLGIQLDGQLYKDGIDITPDEIYQTFDEKKILPKTSAPNPQEYIEHFQKWTDQGYEVVHISLGSGISSSYQNACLAASELPNVYPVDSGNLSTGMGLLVLEAADRIEQGMDAHQIAQEIKRLKQKVHASFVIDTLTYLYEGGRCSALQKYSAALLSIKPCIEVDPEQAHMNVGKKYRGSLRKVFKQYTIDQLNRYPNYLGKRIFITHSGTAEENIRIVKETIEQEANFQEIFITRAGCTISSHCGPNTLGVLFMSEE